MDPRAQVKAWRIGRGWTLTRMAYELGVSVSIVCEWEKATRTPGRENAFKLERLTGIAASAWAAPVFHSVGS